MSLPEIELQDTENCKIALVPCRSCKLPLALLGVKSWQKDAVGKGQKFHPYLSEEKFTQHQEQDPDTQSDEKSFQLVVSHVGHTCLYLSKTKYTSGQDLVLPLPLSYP